MSKSLNESFRLKETLANQAKALGFQLFGIASFNSSNAWADFPETQFFSEWLDKGYAAGMDYLSKRRDERLDIQKYFPEVKSAIACGMYYAQKDPKNTPDEAGVKISRYARGKDYHQVLKKRLKVLARFLESETTCKTRLCVDTSPVSDRMLAYRAGLGWFGKNTCLINREKGSYFFIGTVLTDLDLPGDKPASDHCGTCTLCIEACPTDALRAPQTLDASRCLSYWNIEHRGEIPEAIQNKMGNNFFGCDICQEVCPWNHEKPQNLSTIDIDPHFQGTTSQELFLRLKSTTADNFSEKFSGSPLKRAKFEGLQRNATIVLNNLAKNS